MCSPTLLFISRRVLFSVFTGLHKYFTLEGVIQFQKRSKISRIMFQQFINVYFPNLKLIFCNLHKTLLCEKSFGEANRPGLLMIVTLKGGLPSAWSHFTLDVALATVNAIHWTVEDGTLVLPSL